MFCIFLNTGGILLEILKQASVSICGLQRCILSSVSHFSPHLFSIGIEWSGICLEVNERLLMLYWKFIVA